MTARRLISIMAAMLLFSVQAALAQTDDVLERCPTLARLSSAGKLEQIRDPVFTDRDAAARFATDCAKVAAELERLPSLTPHYADIHTRAALAAEFLRGDTHLLSTSRIGSVVELREEAKIAPPKGFVYVRKYSSESAMPPIVRRVLANMKKQKGTRIQGVTIRGRYIALLQTEYEGELADTLAHEMVHAYLALASGVELPYWFHEGAAVYFSLGDKSKLYNRTDDPVPTRKVRVPEDYKSALHSFQYIESKVGREKLLEFIREGVETGDPDPRMALGLSQPGKPAPSERPGSRGLLIPGLIVGALAAAIVAAWAARRREAW